MSEISIGLVGCGAVVHLNYAMALLGRTRYKVRWVTDLIPAQAESAADLFGATVSTLGEIAEHADAVIISTPPRSHADLVRACLRPGRTILCEKPFTTSRAAAEALVEAATASDTYLGVGHFRRTFPQVELARKLVGAGLIGPVNEISASEGGRFSWSAVSNYTASDPSGGVLWDTGSHTLDMALFAGCLDEDTSLAAHAIEVIRDRPEPSHDYAAKFKIASAGGSISASLRLSRRQTLPNLISLTGSEGSLSFIAGLDRHVRIRTSSGSIVLTSDAPDNGFFAMVDVQVKRIMLKRNRDAFAARRFVGQVALLDELSNV